MECLLFLCDARTKGSVFAAIGRRKAFSFEGIDGTYNKPLIFAITRTIDFAIVTTYNPKQPERVNTCSTGGVKFSMKT